MGLTKVGDELKTYKKSYTAADYTPWLYDNKHKDGKRLRELPPCTFGEPIIEYLNSATVRSLLHIPDTVQAWDLCTSAADWSYDRGQIASQWVYEKLQNKYRILFYSGDTDGAVPTFGSLGWISRLGWAIKEDWRAYMVDGQVGGYL